jgi:hypothetical protein
VRVDVLCKGHLIKVQGDVQKCADHAEAAGSGCLLHGTGRMDQAIHNWSQQSGENQQSLTQPDIYQQLTSPKDRRTYFNDLFDVSKFNKN